MALVLLLFGLVMFVGLVVIHELGHFYAARKTGVEVEEFGIGFPPRAWGKRLASGLLFSINWLPLGGFVKLKGEHDSDTTKGSFGAASLRAKTLIMLAGVAMNLVTAFVLLTILGWIGMPRVVENQFTVAGNETVIRNDVLVGYIEAGSPAEKAGLQLNDKIIAFNGDQFLAPFGAEGLVSGTSSLAGETVDITIERGGQRLEVEAQFRTKEEVEASKNTNEPKGYLGIIPAEYTLTRYTWAAPVVAAGTIKQFTTLTVKGIAAALGNLFQGRAGEAGQQVAGPVGIFVILKDGSLLGIEFVLMIIAIISLTLAIMNALPIPALDGGRLFVTYAYRLARRPLTKSREELIHGTGFALLMVLFVVITVVDVRRNF